MEFNIRCPYDIYEAEWAEENYYTEYKTPGGETISIFGYYGYNG